MTLTRARQPLLIAAVLVFSQAASMIPSALGYQIAPSATDQPPPPHTQPTTLPVTRIIWLGDLGKAYAAAQRARQPIFVHAGTEWCEFCRRLEKVYETPQVAAELANWTLVRIDSERDMESAKALNVNGIPALRVVTATGRIIASQDGFLPGPDLLEFLRQHRQAAAAPALLDLAGSKAPDAALVKLLVEQFGSQDAELREALIRRLRPHPSTVAGVIIDALASGSLGVRLTALELLDGWNAPVSELDPWQPDTITTQRIGSLRRWAAQTEKHAATGPAATSPATLTMTQLATARRDIAQLIAVPTVAQAAPIRERLARHGAALLPEVRQQLQQNPTDLAREQLTVLRYRLACSDALAMDWASGLARLASPDAQARRQAVDELARRATLADCGLLMELFTSSDSVVREMSLRALRSVNGGETQEAMTRLLSDPEPNVRAAVLKELAEASVPGMIGTIAAYIKTETVPDLVVHAVRVLRAYKGSSADAPLKELLTHADWRVRAEAVEALAEIAQSARNSERQADLFVALIIALNDADAFVVGQAVKGLAHADLALAVEPMIAAAKSHPQIAPQVVKTVSKYTKQRNLTTAFLRESCGHAEPGVRAAAITALADGNLIVGDTELKAALKDMDTRVRQAAATAIWDGTRKSDNNESDGQSFGVFATTQPVGTDTWNTVSARLGSVMRGSNSGQAQKKAIAAYKGLATELKPMLAATMPAERREAALALAAIGGASDARGTLLDSVRTDPLSAGRSSEAISGLPAAERGQFFQDLRDAGAPAEALVVALAAWARDRDAQVVPTTWALLADQRIDFKGLGKSFEFMQQLYFGNAYWNTAQMPGATLKRANADLKTRLALRGEAARALAMVLLLKGDAPAAAAAAESQEKEPDISDPLRSLTMRVRLLGLPQDQARALAIAGLSDASAERRCVALGFLAGDSTVVSQVEGIYLYLPGSSISTNSFSASESAANMPKAPAGVTLDHVRPRFVADKGDAQVYAAYLMALLGDGAGIQTLVTNWKKEPDNHQGRGMLYRAVVALNDDEKTPILEEIYQSFDKDHAWLIKEFYWTIRVMKGPGVLKLRERIRREIGMEKLRQ